MLEQEEEQSTQSRGLGAGFRFFCLMACLGKNTCQYKCRIGVLSVFRWLLVPWGEGAGRI